MAHGSVTAPRAESLVLQAPLLLVGTAQRKRWPVNCSPEQPEDMVPTPFKATEGPLQAVLERVLLHRNVCRALAWLAWFRLDNDEKNPVWPLESGETVLLGLPLPLPHAFTW